MTYNNFAAATTRLIKSAGKECEYKTLTQGVYDYDTASVTNTETSTTLVVYKKSIVANQYKFPNLIGKEVAEFYVLNADLPAVPKAQDKIVYEGTEFDIQQVVEYRVVEVLHYVLTAVKVGS